MLQLNKDFNVCFGHPLCGLTVQLHDYNFCSERLYAIVNLRTLEYLPTDGNVIRKSYITEFRRCFLVLQDHIWVMTDETLSQMTLGWSLEGRCENTGEEAFIVNMTSLEGSLQ